MNSPVTVSANCSVYSKSFYWAAKDENGETLDENIVTLAGDGCESEETFTFSTPGTCTLHLCVSKNLFSDEVEHTVVITNKEVPVDDTTPDTDGGDDHIPTRQLLRLQKCDQKKPWFQLDQGFFSLRKCAYRILVLFFFFFIVSVIANFKIFSSCFAFSICWCSVVRFT